jgi:hypothetical protein
LNSGLTFAGHSLYHLSSLHQQGLGISSSPMSWGPQAGLTSDLLAQTRPITSAEASLESILHSDGAIPPARPRTWSVGTNGAVTQGEQRWPCSHLI